MRPIFVAHRSSSITADLIEQSGKRWRSCPIFLRLRESSGSNSKKFGSKLPIYGWRCVSYGLARYNQRNLHRGLCQIATSGVYLIARTPPCSRWLSKGKSPASTIWWRHAQRRSEWYATNATRNGNLQNSKRSVIPIRSAIDRQTEDCLEVTRFVRQPKLRGPCGHGAIGGVLLDLRQIA